MSGENEIIAKVANEYATVWLELDRTANSPRVIVHNKRDHEERDFDPMALALLCQVDEEVLALLADMAKDRGARVEFHDWMRAQRERQSQLAADGGDE